MSQVAADLRALRAFMADPAKFTKMEFARDADGNGIRNGDTEPVCFCIIGAIAQLIPPLQDNPQSERRRRVHLALAAVAVERIPALKAYHGSQIVIGFNDHRSTTHADILSLVDEAVARLA
jgi:hypothetical protein